jgi:asparaginyl-tRNA synthetase
VVVYLETVPDELRRPHKHLQSPITRNVLRVQHAVLNALRERLTALGFVEFLPPIIGPVTDPGIRGAKQVTVDYYGHEYKLMSSGILYKQLALHGFDKIFFLAPNVRLEPPETATTRRHLTEFFQLDVEIAGASYHEAMDVAEDLVRHAIRQTLARCPSELEALGRRLPTHLGKFTRTTHAQAVKELRGLGRTQSSDAEIAWPEEEFLSRLSPEPFFLHDYPKGSRGFYDQEDAARPGILRDFDLLLPEGYGEVASGAEREHTYAKVVARIRETGENPAKYGWYLDMLKDGVPASAGFGIGIERLTRYLTGVDAVWKARPYPKLPGLATP